MYPCVQVAGLTADFSAASSMGAVPAATTMQTLREILREGGPAALFRGLHINYLKVVPSTAIGFALYEALKSAMGCRGNL